jgi:hypothetical protein
MWNQHVKRGIRLTVASLSVVEDRRLLPTDSSSTNGTAMTVQYARPTVVRNPEDSFKNIYSGFVNGIRIPTDEVQHARLTSMIETNGIHDARNVINEEGWIEVKKKGRKLESRCKINVVRPRGLGGLIGVILSSHNIEIRGFSKSSECCQTTSW